ncbi:alcohol dehydrogenase [Pyrenochaeta sp. MPI-SDFR-AT-0127]|nr:alcohol dehydrogenase [Pyrenochaeta sp. MPI-SDFR-AT-0127]
MRALIRTGTDKATLGLDVSHPEPTSADSPNSYIIKTKATALTRGELTWPEPLTPAIPVPGFDFAGVVLAVPATLGAKAFQPGDEVYGLTYPFSEKGNARDITVADEREMSLKPKKLSWEEAAAIPLSALSAWQGLFTHGKLNGPRDGEKYGKRVLVTAASGGVGIWAVQLAHRAGTNVVGTCGPSNVDFVKKLGADIVLDYSKNDLLRWVNEDWESRAFDVVMDCVGGQTLTDAWQCAKKGGIVISVAEPPNPRKPVGGVAEGVEGVWFIVEAKRDQLEEITSLIEEGKCRGEVDRVYELEQWEEAFERLEGGHARGKVVLRV